MIKDFFRFIYAWLMMIPVSIFVIFIVIVWYFLRFWAGRDDLRDLDSCAD